MLELGRRLIRGGATRAETDFVLGFVLGFWYRAFLGLDLDKLVPCRVALSWYRLSCWYITVSRSLGAITYTLWVLYLRLSCNVGQLQSSESCEEGVFTMLTPGTLTFII